MATYIELSTARIRQNVEPNGWAVSFRGDCHEAWRSNNDVVAYDALCVVFGDREAAEAFAGGMRGGDFYTGDGPAPREVYWCDGPQGFVVHEICRD